MKIYLARHCQTDWNAAKRMQGQIDTQLDQTGIDQANRLGRSLIGRDIDLIVSSDLSRAASTAGIVGAMLFIRCQSEPRLREIDYGNLAGKMISEFCGLTDAHNHEDWPDIMAFDYRGYGGEDAKTAFARQKAAMDDLKRRHGYAVALVIGHGHSLRTLLAGLGLDTRIPPQGDYRIIEY